MKGEVDKAIDDFTEAIQYEPDYAEAYYNRGNAYAIKREFDLAMVDFNKAICLEPGHAGFYYSRGHTYGLETRV